MMPETDRKTSVWKDALWICLAGAIGSTLWIAYQSDVWDEATRVQMKIKAQHDEFVVRRHLWDKSQEIKAAAITAAQSRTDVQSQPSIREIQGLQNHVVRERKQRKNKTRRCSIDPRQKWRGFAVPINDTKTRRSIFTVIGQHYSHGAHCS
jgi:hypothetical protein